MYSIHRLEDCTLEESVHCSSSLQSGLVVAGSCWDVFQQQMIKI